MSGDGRLKEFERWPGFGRAWRRAITKWWEEHQDKLTRDGKPYELSLFKSPDELWDWWMGGKTEEEDGGCTMGLF